MSYFFESRKAISSYKYSPDPKLPRDSSSPQNHLSHLSPKTAFFKRLFKMRVQSTFVIASLLASIKAWKR